MVPSPCRDIQEPGRTKAPLPKVSQHSQPAAHHSIPARLSKRWAEGGCCTPGITGAHKSGAGAWKKCCTLRQHGLRFPQGQERRRHGHASPKSQPCKAAQTVCMRWFLNMYLGVQSPAIAFFGGCTSPVVTTGDLILNSAMKPVR